MLRTLRIAPLTVLLLLPTLLAGVSPVLSTSGTIAQTSPSQKAEADRLIQQGLKQLESSQFDLALQTFQQAAAIHQSIGERRGLAWAIANVGTTYRYKQAFSESMHYLQEALALAEAVSDVPLQGLVSGQIGLVHLASYRYPEAIAAFQRELEVFRQFKVLAEERRVLSQLGRVLSLTGSYLEALKYFEAELAIVQELNDLSAKAVVLENLGLVYIGLGGSAEAIGYFQQALTLARTTKTPQLESRQHLNLATAYLGAGIYAEALTQIQAGLALARTHRDRLLEQDALNRLGEVYLSVGNYPEAIAYFQETLRLAASMPVTDITERQASIAALSNLGVTYLRLGDYPKAKDYTQRYLAIAQQVKLRVVEAHALNNLGLIEMELGQYQAAIAHFQETLAIARELKNLRTGGMAFGNLGEAYRRQRNYVKAIEHYQYSLDIISVIKDQANEGRLLNNLGAAWAQAGYPDKAEPILFQAIQILESLRSTSGSDSNKVSLFDTQIKTYKLLQAVLIDQNKPEAALEIAERGRARTFAELLAKRLLPATQPQLSIAPPTIDEIRQIARQQAATLVQYSVMSDQSLFIWVIKPTGDVAFRVQPSQSPPTSPHATFAPESSQTELTSLVNSTRRSLGVGSAKSPTRDNLAFQANSSQAKRQLQRLHQLLIEPIADLLPTDPDQPVIFIPHESLFLVPFPALQDANGQYLIEKHTMLTAPSIQVLALTRQQKAKTTKANTALVVGNPVMPEGLAPLPGAELEARQVAQLLNTQPILGVRAVKTTIVQKMPQARIIHLATHGIFDSYRGLGSSIALASSATDAGFLTAEEILNLNLAADLVVLSACDTGRGQLTGDGVIGLSRSLISAGASSVLVSLWAVNDDSTAVLMTEFYQILQQQPNKAKALRKAMLMTLKKYPNPIDWAAFTLIGEAE